ncbi:MAG TPA: FAD-linked oxidase C-terminal domain-containing protein [Acidimicrobiales bacterium]|nr:FAD-linked oxidase C-terminal domain-containing protein [Acidimicrobiales bacterium]
MKSYEMRAELFSLVKDVTFSGSHNPDDLHDESLHPRERDPLAVARPRSTEEVAALVRWAARNEVPITPRGSGTGLSGGAVPVNGGLVIAFDLMRDVLSLNERDHVAVVQAGITLRELNEALAGTGLHYPVYPGELSGSLGGNVNTNAGGMRAVRHGVTRQHVLGLEVVLADGTVTKTGGPVMKTSSGYDLTQLIIGSEGTLALVTEVTLKLSAVLAHSATLLVPFAGVQDVASVVPTLISSGLMPSLLEYLDSTSLSALQGSTDLRLGVNPAIAAQSAASLVMVLETRTREQLDVDVEAAAQILAQAGALDVYVLEGSPATQLIQARERIFWLTKAAGANEIIDVVVPRSTVPTFLETVKVLGDKYGAFIPGCGHVGDGNVHLSVYLPDDDQREKLLLELFRAGVDLGGAVSGEHGLGLDKRDAYLALTDPALVDLQRRIKTAFDPQGLLNPFRHLDKRSDD